MLAAACFSSGVMACQKVVSHRYPSISLVSALILKVSPAWSYGSIFLTQYLNSMVQVGSRLHARHEFTHIHGYLFVLRTATSPACRSSHWSTMPIGMCLACWRPTRAYLCSRLLILATSLSYPRSMAEKPPSSFRLRTFCEYRYCRKNKLDKHKKIEQHFRAEKKTYLHRSDFCCVWSKPVKQFQHPPLWILPIKGICQYPSTIAFFMPTYASSVMYAFSFMAMVDPVSHPGSTKKESI